MTFSFDRGHGRTRLAPAALVPIALWCALGVCAEPLRTSHSVVELIVEQESLPAEGGTVTAGLYLKPDSGWHAYWSNPGDAGKEASIRWSLPDGLEAGPLQFPAPHLIPFGEFNTYGFDEAILLLVDIAVPAGTEAGRVVELAGRASWVVCDDELCIPERAEVGVTLPVGDGRLDAANAGRFAAARARQPQAVDWPARFFVADDQVDFAISAPADTTLESPYLFVAEKRLVRYAEQTSSRAPGRVGFAMAAGSQADRLSATEAVLRYDDGGETRNVLLTVARGDAAVLPASASPVPTPADAAGSGAGLAGFAKAVAFGLLGGIVLNLMPCVFPILSMKALGLVHLSQGDRRMARASGIFYTAGILVAFALIALVLIGLREAGRAVGWGFQLQSPWVNLVLGLGMVAIGLNLAGVFEIGMRMMGMGQSLTADPAGGERRTAFFTGLLAVVVATPCTAPFMASALGYALAQPAWMALAVFLALGFGLALPYLTLTLMPALGRILPRPGPWMESFRRVLAFPMLATALWLFWVVGRQLGATSMAVALLAALLLAFALWAYGRSAAGGRPLGWRMAAVVGLAACVVAGMRMEAFRAPLDAARGEASGASAGMLGKLTLQRFSPALVQGHIEAKQPVFLYFTADWCISCKANERVALATDAVGDLFNERDIVVVEGDWTREDPVITEWLAKYDRAGVPLYLYFPSGSSIDTAAVLPQVLLPGIVIDAIDRADAKVADQGVAQARIGVDAA